MKKLKFVLIVALTSFLTVNAQKQSGIVYSEHEGINKVKAMWAALIKGDKDTHLSFFADSVWTGNNGSVEKRAKEQFVETLEWGKRELKNVSVVDDKSASPDAIQYKDGELFVQDWLRLKGTHEKTGINLNYAVHNVYHFNKAGKIDAFLQYFNTDVFTEIDNSSRTIENGNVYINHPYIVTVRKCVNAYCAKDIETLKTFYSPKTMFMKSDFKAGKPINLEEKMKEDKGFFALWNNITLQQVGYPDCIYYAKNDNYAVYSWWKLSVTSKDGKTKKDIPLMMIHGFNKNGEIMYESTYLSSNHFQ